MEKMNKRSFSIMLVMLASLCLSATEYKATVSLTANPEWKPVDISADEKVSSTTTAKPTPQQPKEYKLKDMFNSQGPIAGLRLKINDASRKTSGNKLVSRLDPTTLF